MEKGKGINQLCKARVVTVDYKTENIYVSDFEDHCVKVFDGTGKYLFKFGDNENEGKSYFQLCVATCRERILISQGNHCILNYQLNGKIISKIGNMEKGN